MVRSKCLRTDRTIASVLLLSWLTCRCWAEDVPVPEMTISPCKQPPRIDGQLGDECWRGAVMVDNLHVVREAGKMTRRHKAYVTRDERWLYVAFGATLPVADRMPAKWFKHDQLV